MLERPVLRYQEYFPNYDQAVEQLIQHKRNLGYINLAPVNLKPEETVDVDSVNETKTKTPDVVIDSNEMLVKSRGLGLSLDDIISEESSVAQQVNLNYFK
ncbi:hypothetical protein [Weissella koreensis]|uniref:Uncharacterized protein n=1 Tax=Weissella koreensis TaxID=165096 RepID=A0A7H1MNE6_9LACO|nr:hypothetical protein [Weissella koreensis]AVH75780.1 hypothetical protein C4597_07135 [Weissella koreensis]QGN21001.1 hypothetical protein GKC51_07115 [Weissella koreensis]QNT64982.1 hypothetical protein FY536_06850 [Weissella koreensis]